MGLFLKGKPHKNQKRIEKKVILTGKGGTYAIRGTSITIARKRKRNKRSGKRK